ncbi:MAG: hypothetical protein ONB05_06910, partial [candidate division KSB1 bacterium]|nr:hypothetical protein [candidate division KSB1 bacterium]
MAKKLVIGGVIVLVLSLTVGSLGIKAVEKRDLKVTAQKKSLNEEIITKGLTSRQPLVVYSTDFEKAGEWTVEQLGTTGHVFQWVTDSYHSPTHSWHVPDDSAMTEADAVPIETAIVSPDITLPTKIDGGPVTKILMSYWFRVNTPNTAQGGYVYDVWQPEIFVPYEGANFWHTDTTEAYGGTGKSWWCGDPAIGTYRPNWRQELWTPVLNLSGASGTITLSFKNAPNSEPGYDYCYV